MNIKYFLSWFICLMMLTPASYCRAAGKRVERKSVTVRAQLVHDSSVSLQIDNAFEIIDPQTNKTVFRASRFNEKIHITNGALAFGKRLTFPPELLFQPTRAEFFRLNGVLYRGSLKLIVDQNKILAVNYLPMEDYIKSVVPSEISKLWDYEVLKAQAVAARTFTYQHRNVNSDKHYDIPYGLQQYKGVIAENARTSWAVDVTFGQVLFYHDKVFPAFFHTVCGGYTEQGEAVWPTAKGLPGVTACSYCSNNSYFIWEHKFTSKELADKLNKAGYKVNSVDSIEPHEKAPFYPRIRSLTVHADGKRIVIPANRFRAICGYNVIRSSIFTVTLNGNTFKFNGRGWGHGVGLCQYGAKTLAELHKDYLYILEFYYPKTELKRVY